MIEEDIEPQFFGGPTTLDAFKLFETQMFTVTGSHWSRLSETRQVCLGAQSSVDRLHWLVDLVQVWSGPISIALFVPDMDAHISLVYIAYLQSCYKSIQRQVRTRTT